MKQKQQCCICSKTYYGYGNNAEPIKHGKCCDKCNLKVIIARIEKLCKEMEEV